MPIFKKRIAFKIARDIRAFLYLDVGLIRGSVPDIEQKFRQAQNQIKRQDQRAKATAQKLADRNRDIVELYEQIGKITRETKSRHEYKAVWNAVSRTRRHATGSVLGATNIDEESLHANGEETRRTLESTVGLKPEDVILEIGCGIGRVGRVLAPRCKQWIGCDVSTNMLGHAQKRLASFDNVKLVELSGYDLSSIEDSSVDLVYCTVVFMHLDEWDRYNYVLEAHRVLRTGGRIFVDNFNLRSEEGWDVFEGAWKMAPEERPPHIGKSSTPQELEVYLQRGKFREVQTVEDGLLTQAYGVK